MYSFSFPNMLEANGTSAKLLEDKEAIRSNLLRLLASERETLFGDPYFGCQLRKYMFEQSTSLIADLLIDHIYTSIITFMPQVMLTRKDIRVLTSKNNLFVEIRYYYVRDNTSDLFTIKLTEDSNED